jgi:hypothetical protein
MKKVVDTLEQEVIESKERDQEIIETLNELKGEMGGRGERDYLKVPDIPEDDFIQKTLPNIDIRQMTPIEIPRR